MTAADLTDPGWHWQDGRVFSNYRDTTIEIKRLNNHGREIVYSYYIDCPGYYGVVGPLYQTAQEALIAANIRVKAYLTNRERRP